MSERRATINEIVFIMKCVAYSFQVRIALDIHE